MSDELQEAEVDRPQKIHKLSMLWQQYLFFEELEEMRKRHLLRISAIKRGVCQMDAGMEQDFIDTFGRGAKGAGFGLDSALKSARRQMIKAAKATTGPIWEWITSIRGLSEGKMAAQLLAQIDDIGRFDTVSKLWRYCGYAVIDGHIDAPTKGQVLPYNRRLKSLLYLIGDEFIRMQTPIYAEIYYEEKAEQRRQHPEPYCTKCACVATECRHPAAHRKARSWDFTDAHIHNRARRKMVKIFLQHLWVTWRQLEGLPISEPYVQAIMGHTNIITAPGAVNEPVA